MLTAKRKISLSALWPRPDWSSYINDERPDEVIKILTGVYHNIRELPRENEGAIPNAQWHDAYITSISVLKALFRKTKTIEQAQTINERFASRFDFDYNNINNQPIENSYLYWAASRKSIHLNDKDAFNLTIKTDEDVVNTKESAGTAGLETNPETIKSNQMPLASKDNQSIQPVRRFGPVFITKDIDIDQFQYEFNFKQIVLSPDTQDKNQHLLNQAFESLCDLADALDLPRKWVGMTTLTLRVGHANQLDTDDKYQSITYNGENSHKSIAHQWINCLDVRIANIVQENLSLVDRYVSTMYQKELTGNHIEKIKAVYLIVKKITNGMSSFSGNKLDYYHASVLFESEQSLIAGSITAPQEMFARAFDVFIEDRLNSLSRSNHNLTTNRSQLTIAPVPTNKERISLGLLFTALFIALKQPESNDSI